MTVVNRFGYPILLILLCILPFVTSSYTVSIATEIFIFAIFALSLNILVGYTGLVSLGHAAFFGVGAYAAGLLSKHLSASVWLTLVIGLVAAIIAAAIIGFFCNRVSGFYFLMLTLAFSQMIYGIAHQWTTVTGGDNGLSGIPKPVVAGEMTISHNIHLYFFILVIFVLVFLLLRLFVSSPLGAVLIGIKENETRMRAIGYNTTFYKNLAFIIAGGLGGLAGVLFTYFNGFVSPGDVYWTMSGKVLMMTLIGGAGTLLGPVLGAAFIVILETFVSSYTDYWMWILGATFIFFVIFVPGGIVGLRKFIWKHAKLGKDQPLLRSQANAEQLSEEKQGSGQS